MTRPRLADPFYHEDCARAATHLLRMRIEGLPAFVRAGTIDQAAADRSILLAEATDRQWRWVIDRTRPLLPEWRDGTGYFGAYCFDLAADLDRAFTRQQAAATRSATDEKAAILADLYAALAWWQGVPSGALKSWDCRIIMHAAYGRRGGGA